MKILLVEDNVSLCRNIASVLQNEGYTVVTCSNGNEAEFQMLNNRMTTALCMWAAP